MKGEFILKSAVQVYKELVEKELPKKEINYLFSELDEKIAKALAKAGYSTNQIETAILHESPAVKNKTTEEIDRYLHNQVRRDLPDHNVSFSVNDAYKKEKEKFLPRFEELFLKKDLDFSCRMLDDGYSLKEVIENLRRDSLLSLQFKDEKLLTNYADKVLALVNTERILRAGKVYDLAKKVYLEKAAGIVNKYASYSRANYNSFNEGSVVISMMLQHRFFPEVIEEVLRKNSFYPHADEAYIRDVMDKCRKVQQAYIDISKTISPKSIRTEEDAYRFFAREYMERTHTEVLNGRDEKCIISRMYAEKFPRRFILSALSKASPVAIEPGRDKDMYISTVITSVENEYENKKAFAEKQYPVTAVLYDEKMERLSQRLKDKGYIFGIDKNRSYYDATAARELLEERQSFTNIVRVIAEKSSLAIKKNPMNPNKTPEGYAKWIVRTAQKVLKAEKDLTSWEQRDIPKNLSYKQLINSGITSLDLFKQAFRERLDTYPSLCAILTAPFIDKDISEKLLTRYPDFDKDDLADILRLHSPRALMPGISDGYSTTVIEAVEKRLEIAHKQKDYIKTVQQEYNKQCGLAAEGVGAESNMSSVYDYRSAFRMLLNHVDPIDVRNAIFAAAKTALVMAPMVYANDILHKVEAVHERLKRIEDNPPVLNGDIQTAEEDYKNKFAAVYQQKKFPESSMDIEVIKSMLLEDQFKTSEILKAMRENSPVAIEPGRDNRYVEYIEKSAKNLILWEKEKLQNYKPVPRIEHEENAKKEYEHHREELLKTISLPYSSQMDVMIAETMLIQGFTSGIIAMALTTSPCAEEQVNYGSAIIKKAEKNFAHESVQEHPLVRTLIKTTETTITTTSANS